MSCGAAGGLFVARCPVAVRRAPSRLLPHLRLFYGSTADNSSASAAAIINPLVARLRGWGRSGPNRTQRVQTSPPSRSQPPWLLACMLKEP